MDLLPVKLLHAEARLPVRAHDGDLGYDLHAASPEILLPGDWSTVHTGIALALPKGMAGLVLPRSGLAARHGVTVLNAPGLVDAGYRGEVGVVLINHSDQPFHISPGDRIAQLLLTRTWIPHIQPVDRLPESSDQRGAGGFGSSGLR